MFGLKFVFNRFKIDMFSRWTSKNQYFLSLDHCNSICSVPGPLKTNIFCPRTTKNQYFLFLDH